MAELNIDDSSNDDEYDETFDASAQAFSPRGADTIEELLGANPFEDSEEEINLNLNNQNYSSDTLNMPKEKKKTTKHVLSKSNSESIHNVICDTEQDNLLRNSVDWKEKKGKKKLRVWGFIGKGKGKSESLDIIDESTPKRKHKKYKDKTKTKQKKGKRKQRDIIITRNDIIGNEVISATSSMEFTNINDKPVPIRKYSSLDDVTINSWSSKKTLNRSLSLEINEENSSTIILTDEETSPLKIIQSNNVSPSIENKKQSQKIDFVVDSKEERVSTNNNETRPKSIQFSDNLYSNHNYVKNSNSRQTTSESPQLTNKRKTKKPNKTIPKNIPGAIIFQLVPIKEGYLLHKRRKRWIILDKQNIYIFKSVEDFKEPKIINLHCSAVRRVVKEATPSLEIITSGNTFIFTVSKEEKGNKTAAIDSWINEIRSVCDELVLSSIGGNGDEKNDNILSKSYSTLLSRSDVLNARAGNMPAEQRQVIEVAVQDGNRICADCGAKEPEWASINIGVFICIECSGIHRSFGTHISKVRSVKLDKWEYSWVEIMRSIGNIRANKVWLFNVPSEFTPITATSNLDERKKWLNLKYVEGRFTADWKPEETEKALNDIKKFSQEFRTQFKTVLLQCLEEDIEFRKQLKDILTNDNINENKEKEPNNELDNI